MSMRIVPICLFIVVGCRISRHILLTVVMTSFSAFRFHMSFNRKNRKTPKDNKCRCRQCTTHNIVSTSAHSPLASRAMHLLLLGFYSRTYQFTPAFFSEDNYVTFRFVASFHFLLKEIMKAKYWFIFCHWCFPNKPIFDPKSFSCMHHCIKNLLHIILLNSSS